MTSPPHPARTSPSLVPTLLPALAALAAVGCGAFGGTGLFREGHRTTPAAEELRQQVQETPPVPRELDKRLAGPYIVEPGDVLLVQPADLDSPVRLPGDQPVLSDGTIHLGKYGRLIVAGKTIEEIETQVRSLVLAKTKDAGDIVVRVVTRQSKVFYVLGEVHAPGAFIYNGRETVLDAIVLAGGLTDRASHDRILLSRPTLPDSGRKVLPVCWDDIVQVGDTTTNYQLAPGDRIFVPSKGLCEDLQTKKCRKEGGCGLCGRPQFPAGDHPPGPPGVPVVPLDSSAPALMGPPTRWTPPEPLPAPAPLKPEKPPKPEESPPQPAAWAGDGEAQPVRFSNPAATLERPRR